MKHPLNAFRDLTDAGSRLGFFTRRTRDDIPAGPGCYGWFLPLWLLRHTLPEFLNLFGSMMIQEPTQQQEVKARFTWDTVTLRREFDPSIPESKIALWDRLHNDEHAHDALQQTLLQASILTPPLYVGMTADLRQRYNQHTAPPSPGTNNFHSRFAECAKQLDLGLALDDLIFICIRTGREDKATLSESGDIDEINGLLEEILKRLCRPPFSRR